jgi:two-component system OmpR family response regulator
MTGDYEIREVNNGSEAVKAALEFRPDLILLDVVMPDVSGEAILAEIRKFKELAATHVAFLTGRSPSQVQLDENTSFIGKPIQIPELVAVVESMIARLPDRIA